MSNVVPTSAKRKEIGVVSSTYIPEPLVSKHKYTICNSCDTQFTQKWDSVKGIYSQHKKCQSCISKEQTEQPKTAMLKLDYKPYRYQEELHNSKARCRLVAGGIRSGKDYAMTTEFFVYLLKCANEDRPKTLIPKVRGWIIAPWEDIAKENFAQLKRLIPAELILDASPSTGTVITKNGIEINIKSAYTPESLVGVGLDAVLITEASRIKDMEIVWSNVSGRLTSEGRGLGGKGGIALINSSPLGKNYFYKMWTWGQKKHPDWSPEWESFTWTHWDNPTMAARRHIVQANGKTYEENICKQMSESRYKQDYLAMFLLNEFSVFPEFDNKCLNRIPPELKGKEREKYIEDWREPKPYEIYSIGYDPASIGDQPILWVIENDTGKLKRAINLKGKGWDSQFDEIQMWSRVYNHAIVKFGRTGHETINSQLEKRGLVTVPINEQGSNKANLVENLAIVVENGGLQVLDDNEEVTERIKFEFGDYVREQRKNNIVYKNGTSDGHDDHVSAGYFAFHGLGQKNAEVPFIGYIGAL